MPAWAYVILGFIALIAAGTLWGRIRTRRIAASRAGESFDTFRAGFGADEPPQAVLRAVYAKLQRWCSDAVAAFPVRAEDDMGDIYGLADEDLDDMIREVLAEIGRQLPPEATLWRMPPIVMVREFALFVAACPLAGGAGEEESHRVREAKGLSSRTVGRPDLPGL